MSFFEPSKTPLLQGRDFQELLATLKLPFSLDLHRSFSHNQFAQVPAGSQEFFMITDIKSNTLLNRSVSK
jgi:hypothetical protein